MDLQTLPDEAWKKKDLVIKTETEYSAKLLFFLSDYTKVTYS